MKLMMFEKGKGAALGLVEGNSVIDLAAADPVAAQGPQGPDRRRPRRARLGQSGRGQGAGLRQARARQGQARAAHRPAGQDHLRRPQLRAARQGRRARHPHLPIVLPARADLAGSGRRARDPAQGLQPARLRVRAHHRHRQGRPPHPGGQGARARVRLHALQRRVRARLPAQDLAVDAGQELRRHRARSAPGSSPPTSFRPAPRACAS